MFSLKPPKKFFRLQRFDGAKTNPAKHLHTTHTHTRKRKKKKWGDMRGFDVVAVMMVLSCAALLVFGIVRFLACRRPMLQLKDIVEERTTIFYHDPCTDGYAAMICALQALRPGAIFIPCAAGGVDVATLKPGRLRELAGRYVLFLDCSPLYPVVRAIVRVAADVLVIDHHKKTLDDLAPLPRRYKWLDMNRSGAMLAWNYFVGGATEPLSTTARVAPWFIHYVQDNDLFTHALPQSRAFAAFINKRLERELFTKLLNDSNSLIPGAAGALSSDVFKQVVEEGERVATTEKATVQKALTEVVVRTCLLPDQKQYRVAYYADAPFEIRSQLGNLMVTSLTCDFAALYTYDAAKKTTKFSLRSLHPTGSGADVNAIAGLYGGGGHVSASGCDIPGQVVYLGTLA
jgi:oligoribonuclease NrnB/cAMP/cGMP phosphodiesterase (DHH superfamily)